MSTTPDGDGIVVELATLGGVRAGSLCAAIFFDEM
jgi:hypothetical protein